MMGFTPGISKVFGSKAPSLNSRFTESRFRETGLCVSPFKLEVQVLAVFFVLSALGSQVFIYAQNLLSCSHCSPLDLWSPLRLSGF